MKLLMNTLQKIRKVYWFIIRPSTLGVKALLIKNGEVLLVKNSYDSFLYLPGGGVKRNETSEQGICRELIEETAIKVIKLHLIGKYSSRLEHKNDTIHLYYIDEFEMLLNKKESPEIDTVKFYPLNNLPENVSSATRKRLMLNATSYEEKPW